MLSYSKVPSSFLGKEVSPRLDKNKKIKHLTGIWKKAEHIKGIVHPKMKILSYLFTLISFQPVWLFSSVKNILMNVVSNQTFSVPIDFHYLFIFWPYNESQWEVWELKLFSTNSLQNSSKDDRIFIFGWTIPTNEHFIINSPKEIKKTSCLN